MASEVKANKLSPSSGTTLTLGDASDTVTLPTGVTFNLVDGLGVAAGGTGLTSFTAGDVLYATGSTTLAKLAKGSAEQILSMNSGATAPEWTTAAATAGGTGLTSFTAGDLLYANSTTTLTKLGKGTGLQGLQTNSGATAPEWANSPQSLMTAAGDILYASGANTLAKLAKGSDTEVLTLASGVPSWAAPAGGGMWTLIETQTASSDATIDFTTLSTDYRDFKVIGSGISCATNAVDPWIRYRVSTSWVDSGTTYDWAAWGWDITNQGGAAGGDGATSGWGDKTADYIRLVSPYQGAATSGLGNTSGYTLGFEYTVFDVHSANYTQSIFGAALTLGGGPPSIGALQYAWGGGAYSTSTAIDGVRFQFSSGDIAAGSLSFYGRKIS